jgi:peptide/nickel transport system substrate-binding protein
MRVRHPWERARRSAASLVLITSILAVACAPTASAPTAAPAKPAEAVKPSEAAKPAAPAAPAAAPAAPAASPATGAVAKVQPKGAIAIVLESDGDTINPKDGTTDNAGFVMMNVYDQLTTRDWSSGTMKIVPKLAESWEQSQADPKTWRFKLRPGLKFINGEPINADAVVNMVSYVTNPDKPGLSIDEYGLGAGAKAAKVDEYTVDITTGAVDAIYPARAARMGIPAPKWLATMPTDASITQAVGSGPYQLVEFAKGSHFLLKANESYWGPNKPTIGEIKILFRNEAAVRASMVQAGEVQLATLLTPEAAKALPAYVVEQTGEAAGIRINPEHPVLKDLRVRQAINMAFDRKSMIDALYSDVAEPLNGQLVRKTSMGWNPNLKEYPYDPAKAKQLVQEAGAVGTNLTLITRQGQFPRVDEVAELFANQVNQTGLKITVQSLEVGQWRTVNSQVKPGQARADLFLSASSDPVLDSSRTMAQKMRCGGVNSAWCDEEWTAKFNTAQALSGEARSKAFQELWQIAYDQNVMIPLFGLNFVHGLSPKFHWDPTKRNDLVRDFTQWTLDD